MLDVPASAADAALPADIPCRRYLDIAALLPVLVRRVPQDAWHKQPDLDLAANDVFSEEDGLHSFFEIASTADLATVGTFLSRGGDKPYRRAAYFCALPSHLVELFSLIVEDAPTDSACPPLNAMHRHVLVDPVKKASLFAEIQSANLFNFRVDKRTMHFVRDALSGHHCLDYSNGPCDLCAAATV